MFKTLQCLVVNSGKAYPFSVALKAPSDLTFPTPLFSPAHSLRQPHWLPDWAQNVPSPGTNTAHNLTGQDWNQMPLS